MAESRIKPKGKVFRDPVHRLIRISPDDGFVLDLIDTDVFQRLRRIRQLGVSWLTYHGAEHSRFSHSLGVFNFAQRILNSLRDRYKGTEVADSLDEHSQELKAAALLHDVGHGPFSHMLERAFDHSPDHEEITVRLIRSDPIAGILKSSEIDPNQVAEIIDGTSANRLIRDIVSSQLDADRMDYLLRDSLFTGVEYGKYDAEWIIRNLCVGKDPGAPVGGDSVERLRVCLDRDRGLYSAEQLIVARLHMSMQVYMHRVTRGYETLLLNIFKLAASLMKRGELPSDTPEVVIEYFRSDGDLPPDLFAKLDEPAMFVALSAWSVAPDAACTDLRKMSSAVLSRRRYYSSRRIAKDFAPLRTLELSAELAKLGRRGIDWEFDSGELLTYKGLLYSASKPREDAEEQSAESILLSRGEPGDRAVAVEVASELFQSLDFQAQRVQRVYFDREKIAEYSSVLNRFSVTSEA